MATFPFIFLVYCIQEQAFKRVRVILILDIKRGMVSALKQALTN
jgi:hypothetical protein